jgi:hypothetical protein
MWSFELINDLWFPIFKIIRNQKIANLISLKKQIKIKEPLVQVYLKT